MKTWQKNLILGSILCVLLIVSFGAIVARENQQSGVVYTNTQTAIDYFTADSPAGTHWYWCITMNGTGDAFFLVTETPGNREILRVVRSYSDGGSLTGEIRDGYTYRLATTGGTLLVPGLATCSVAQGDYGETK
jgi:hypothetical protein